MKDVFQIEPLTHIDRAQSYICSYPHILSAMKTPHVLDEQAFVCGAHMVYGWMPTILEIHISESVDVHAGVALLNKARIAGRLSCEEIEQLASLINHSVVGASKLLHFVNPEAFAIWDSGSTTSCAGRLRTLIESTAPVSMKLIWTSCGACSRTIASLCSTPPSTGKWDMPYRRCAPLKW